MTFTQARLARQGRLFGARAMDVIEEQKVCMVGVSRNGGASAVLLAHSGFMRFRLVDPDYVETHNLNAGVAFKKKDIGRLKVEVVKERLFELDPAIECEAYPFAVQDARAQATLDSSDIVIDATDSIPAKKFLNARVAENVRKGKDQRLLSLGSGAYVRKGQILQLGAQATLFEKGGACLMCGPLDAEDESNLSRVSFVVVNVLASLLGLQLLLSSLIRHDRAVAGGYNFILYDCLSQQVVRLNRLPRQDCEYCGPCSKGGLKCGKPNSTAPAAQVSWTAKSLLKPDRSNATST
jgi:molybdopterin/thiamine biosynthesis adenylyltransferase